MRIFLKELREGYYFLLVKLRGRSQARIQLDFGFKALFFCYYISVLCIIVVLLTHNHPLHLPKNILTYSLCGLLVMYPYDKISRYLLREVEIEVIDEYQSKGIIRRKIFTCVAVFLGSFLSLLIPIFLSMGLTGKL